MKKRLLLWLVNSRGTTAIEYSLIVGGIAAAIMTAVFAIGSDMSGLYNSVGAMAAKFAP